MNTKLEWILIVLKSTLSDKIERCQDGRDRRQEVYVRKNKRIRRASCSMKLYLFLESEELKFELP